MLANIKPVAYLQAIVVFSGTGAAATFCVPTLMLAYWRRTTVAGTLASMITGAGTMLVLYILGAYGPDIGAVTSFRPYYLFNIDPLVWGLIDSLVVGAIVSLATTPPEPALVSKMFDADSAPAS